MFRNLHPVAFASIVLRPYAAQLARLQDWFSGHLADHHPQHQQCEPADCEDTGHGQRERFEVIVHIPSPCVVPPPCR
jgi:hypothetical protein